MRGKNPDLHGYAPDSAPLALLIIDMLSDFEFDGSDRIFDNALKVAHHIARLKTRAVKAAIPCIYVNDNVGKWQSAAQRVVDQAVHPERRGYPIGALLQPDRQDYFVLKPKHSAFFATPLEVLLSYIGANALILTGGYEYAMHSVHRHGRLCARFQSIYSEGLHHRPRPQRQRHNGTHFHQHTQGRHPSIFATSNTGLAQAARGRCTKSLSMIFD